MRLYLAEAVRLRLGKTPAELPLARVLEGGTWAAGRAVARELRPGGGSPLLIRSDGTVHAPDRPGLGFTLRADALERFRYVHGPEFEF